MQKTSFPRMHVSLYVSNLEASLAFYKSFFGQEAEKVENGYAKFILDQPSLIISFIENPEKVQSQFGHLGFQVETKAILEKQMNRVGQLGLEIREELDTNCCYASQDKFWAADPDGYQWEVYYFHKDVAYNDPHYAQEAAACCSPAMEAKPKLKLSEIQNANACEPGSGCC